MDTADPDFANRVRLWHGARSGYRKVRLAPMTTAAFEKAGVCWKWKLMEDLIERRSEREYTLAADEACFGMSQDRPKIEPVTASGSQDGLAPTTAAVLD
ncbi:MAG: hypothetical protein WAS21_12430 [Geminicoccaceae bacterium]